MKNIKLIIYLAVISCIFNSSISCIHLLKISILTKYFSNVSKTYMEESMINKCDLAFNSMVANVIYIFNALSTENWLKSLSLILSFGIDV